LALRRTPRRLRMCTQPMMAFSGVRSSCDSTAMKSSLVRLWRSATRAPPARAPARPAGAAPARAARRRRWRSRCARRAPRAPRCSTPGAPAAIGGSSGNSPRQAHPPRAGGDVALRRRPRHSGGARLAHRLAQDLVARRPSMLQQRGVGVGEAALASSSAMPLWPGRRWRGSAARCGAAGLRRCARGSAPAGWRPAPPAPPGAPGSRRRRR
jgi:hypothetical protein